MLQEPRVPARDVLSVRPMRWGGWVGGCETPPPPPPVGVGRFWDSGGFSFSPTVCGSLHF